MGELIDDDVLNAFSVVARARRRRCEVVANDSTTSSAASVSTRPTRSVTRHVERS